MQIKNDLNNGNKGSSDKENCKPGDNLILDCNINGHLVSILVSAYNHHGIGSKYFVICECSKDLGLRRYTQTTWEYTRYHFEERGIITSNISMHDKRRIHDVNCLSA